MSKDVPTTQETAEMLEMEDRNRADDQAPSGKDARDAEAPFSPGSPTPPAALPD